VSLFFVSKEDAELRRYRLPRARIGLRVMYAFLAAFWVVLIQGYQHDHGSVPIVLPLACTVTVLAVFVWDRRVLVNFGLDESPDGFVDHHTLGRRSLRLDDIERFDHRRTVTFDQVYAALRDGQIHPIVSLQEGQRVVWQDGETRHIVEVLNERLRARRQAPTR
jgi:hypothetical protein